MNCKTLVLLTACLFVLAGGDITSADVMFNFNNSTYTKSGTGGSATFRWSNVGLSNGNPFDLVVSHVNGNTNDNGNSGIGGVGAGFGRLNLSNDGNSGAAAVLNFAFVDSNDVEVVLSDFDFSFYDIDGTDAVQSNFERIVLNANSANVGGTITSSFVGADIVVNSGASPFDFSSISTTAANPTDPQSLTPEQRNRSITFDMQNVSSFDVGLSVSTNSGRNFLFSGFTAVPEPSSAILGLLGLTMILRRRRRK